MVWVHRSHPGNYDLEQVMEIERQKKYCPECGYLIPASGYPESNGVQTSRKSFIHCEMCLLRNRPYVPAVKMRRKRGDKVEEQESFLESVPSILVMEKDSVAQK